MGAPSTGLAPSQALPAAPGAEDPAEEDDAEDRGPEVEDERRGRCLWRSRSGSRPRDEDAASGARDDEEDEVDLTSYLSEARIARLSDEKKAELRQIVRKDWKQQHFAKYVVCSMCMHSQCVRCMYILPQPF